MALQPARQAGQMLPSVISLLRTIIKNDPAAATPTPTKKRPGNSTNTETNARYGIKTGLPTALQTTFRTSPRARPQSGVQTSTPIEPQDRAATQTRAYATYLGGTTYDITSFYPLAGMTYHPTFTGTSADSPTVAGGATSVSSTSTSIYSSTSTVTSAAAPPTQSGSRGVSTTLLVLAIVFGAVIVFIAAVVFLIWKRRRRSDPPGKANNQQETPRKGHGGSQQSQTTPTGRSQNSGAKRFSNMLLPSTSRATENSGSNSNSRRRRQLYFPAPAANDSNKPFHPADRIEMEDMPSPSRREQMEPVEAGPSNRYAVVSPVDIQRPSPRRPPPQRSSPQQRTTTIGSLLEYYQNSGDNSDTREYQQVPMTPNEPIPYNYETIYQDLIPRTTAQEQNQIQEQESDHDRLCVNCKEPRDSGDTYAQGHAQRFSPGSLRVASGSNTRYPTFESALPPSHASYRPNQTVFTGSPITQPQSHQQTPTSLSHVTSESALNPRSEAQMLQRRLGLTREDMGLEEEIESVAGIVRPVADSSLLPALRAREAALPRLGDRILSQRQVERRGAWEDGLEDFSRRGGIGSGAGVYGASTQNGSMRGLGRKVEGSIAGSSTTALRPQPLAIRKVSSNPLPGSRPGPSTISYGRSGYEPYMEDLYGVGGSGGNSGDRPTEDGPVLHPPGSYESWLRGERIERSGNPAASHGHRYNLSDSDAVNYNRGGGAEAWGTQSRRRPLFPLESLTEDDFNPAITVAREREQQANDTRAETQFEDHEGIEPDRPPQASQVHQPASHEWYHLLRSRLQSQTPDSSRLSQVDLGGETPRPGPGQVANNELEAGDIDDGYEYASTTISEDIFLPRVRDIRAGRVPPPVGAGGSSEAQQLRMLPYVGGNTGHEERGGPTTDERHESRFKKLKKKGSSQWRRLSGKFHKTKEK